MSVSGTKSFIARRLRAQVLYGENPVATGYAMFVTDVITILSDKLLTDRATEDEWESFFRDRRTQSAMRWLLRDALKNPERLHDIAGVLIQLKNGGVKTATCQAVTLELITAYENCDSIGFFATLPAIRRVFIERYGDSRWPGDVSARRTLRAIDVPLREAKRGRPKGAKSKQKEYGLGKQARKLKH
jgi:hypothetical protein